MGHVARSGGSEIRVCWSEALKERDRLKNRGLDGMIIYNLVKKTEPDWVLRVNLFRFDCT
jgi:hypothetical protein